MKKIVTESGHVITEHLMLSVVKKAFELISQQMHTMRVEYEQQHGQRPWGY